MRLCPILEGEDSSPYGGDMNLYGSVGEPIGDCCRESCPLFSVLRYRAPSSPIHLSEVTEQALRLIARIPLIQRREKRCSREGKSAFP